MPEGVLITGIGCISSIGKDVAENFSSLKRGVSGIDAIEVLDTFHKGEIPAAEVGMQEEGLMELAGVSDPTLYSRTTLLGLIAARDAMEDAGIIEEDARRTGLISGTTTGGMRMTEKYYRDFLENGSKNAYIPRHDCGDSTERIGDELGIKGFLTTINTACSSSANSLMLGARMIREGKLDRVIAGGTDALSKFTLNGFNTLYILDREPCKPFDAARKGLNLGEGGAFLVLESEAEAERRGVKGMARLHGYGNSNDAYHQTASSPEGDGAFKAMEKALRSADLASEKVSAVNVHGTGTPNNDLSEAKALQRIFGEGKVPPFSSTKSFTGHTLGAAGAVEAVYSVLSLQHGCHYPNLHFHSPMEEMPLKPETTYQEGQEVRHILSNSFGFGGNNSSLLFSRI